MLHQQLLNQPKETAAPAYCSKLRSDASSAFERFGHGWGWGASGHWSGVDRRGCSGLWAITADGQSSGVRYDDGLSGCEK